VPRLSIVIPLLGDVPGLERTLVSVLENRPEDAEVLAPLNAPYEDPYGLRGEVRFVVARPGAGWVESAQAGVAASEGEVVALLEPGVEARPGWCETALRHFADPRMAAVAPVVRSATRPDQVLSTGVSYQPGGVRNNACLLGTELSNDMAPRTILGPGRLAGFYRRAAWELLGGLAPEVGDARADVDLALRMRYCGLKATLEPKSVVWADGVPANAEGAYRGALQEERLFWRASTQGGWLGAFASHLGVWAVDAWRSALRGRLPLVLAGRLQAAIRFAPQGRRLRVDAAEGTPAPGQGRTTMIRRVA
jgi:GT2 family glycosyltransferase